ncbi:hypothetical protein SDC9_128743 [bioreactor metagenome]|uniref:Uncharacterized protein n=1 Tax=bioreactor metagenome TaxID=1076179 RepID=A0A645CX45_9ZZZZ
MNLASACGSKGVFLIIHPSAGEVFANVTVTLVFHTVHHNFRAVIELGNATGSEQKRHGLLEGLQVLSFSQVTVGVMILIESKYHGRVRIQEIVYKTIVNAV